MAPAEPTSGAAARLTAGVNLAGYFDSMLGVGEVARRVRRALQAGGVPVSAHNLSGRPARELAGELPAAEEADVHPVNLLCVNAEGVEGAVAELGDGFFNGRYTIGIWWWEVTAFPDRWLRAFDRLDELWVGSHHVADALAPVSRVPVVRMPPPLPEPADSASGPTGLELPEGFLFLFAFDYASVFERKNPLAVMEAFKRAFRPGEGPKLVVKALGGDRHPAEHKLVKAAAGDRPDVHVLDAVLSPADMDALMAACDCYVSLHRSEGFGLTIADAMMRAKPVIATAYSGPRDYLGEANAFPVGFELVPIGEGCDPYPADGRWAEPHVDEAARLMRRVIDDPDAARALGERARADIHAAYSLEASGTAMARRLERVCTLPVDSSGRVSALDLGELEARMRAEPPGRPADGPLPKLRRPLRQAVLRLIRPYAVQRRHVDEELVRVLRTLDERLQGLAAAQASIQAELAELRRKLAGGDR